MLDVNDSKNTLLELQQKIDSINEQASASWRRQPAQALEWSKEAEVLARDTAFSQSAYQKGLLKSLITQAYAQVEVGNYAGGLQAGIAATEMAVKIDDKMAMIQATEATGRAYLHLTNYPSAQACFAQQILDSVEINYLDGQVRGHVGLSSVFGESGEIEACVVHAQKAIHLLTSSTYQDDNMLCGCYLNLALAFAFQNQFQEAVEFGQKAVLLAREQSLYAFPNALLNLATIFARMENFDRALAKFNELLAHLESNPHSLMRLVTLYELGKLYIADGQVDLAKNHIETSLQMAIEHENLWKQADCYEQLSLLAQQEGDIDKTFALYQKFHNIQRQAIGKEKTEQLQKLRASFEVELAQKEAELLRLQTEELEQQVRQRTSALKMALKRERILGNELQDALAQSQQANLLRSRIIETVSHEFRTPLAIINTTVDLLTMSSAKLDDERKAKLRQRISNSIFYISNMLEDITLIETADAQTVDVRLQSLPFSVVYEQLKKRLNEMSEQQDRLHFQLQDESEQVISTDPSLLNQIVEILVSNGLNFSEGIVMIEARLGKKMMQFSVSDEGIGVLPDERESIFELLVRGSNVETRRGLGVGLYIGQLLTELLEGSLTVRSEGAERGATFTVKLPI